MDASSGAVLDNSPQRHSIIISPPEEWVVGSEEKRFSSTSTHYTDWFTLWQACKHGCSVMAIKAPVKVSMFLMFIL